MIDNELGSGRYCAGIVLSADGGAVVVVEKRPKPTGRAAPLESFLEEWIDEIVICGAEVFSGRHDETVARISARLSTPEMADDHIACVDTTSMGEPLRHQFSDHGVHPFPVKVATIGDTKPQADNVQVVHVGELQTCVTLAFEAKRIRAVKLDEGPAILRALENLEYVPATGPRHDLAFAAAIAVWSADRHPTSGPWASRKRPPRGSDDEGRLIERHLQREAIKELQRNEDEWWTHQ